MSKLNLTYIIVLLTILISCETDQKKASPIMQSTENLYKKLKVSRLTQYAHDLAFYKPDDLGRPIQTSYFNRVGEIIKIERYDKSGHICESRKVNSKSIQNSEKAKREQTNKDSLTIQSYNPDGELLNKTNYTYNNKGQKTGVLKFDSDGKLVEKTTYTYYENGLIKQDVYWNTEIKKPEQIINYKYEYQ